MSSDSGYTAKGFFYGGTTLNLTRIEEIHPGKYRLSPRKTFCGVKIATNHDNAAIPDPDNPCDME